MKEPSKHYARLLVFYPKSYRRQRGDEIVSTLLDASPKHIDRPALRDVTNIAAHGLRMRLGLTSERFAGRIFGLAAAPGLAMALVLAASLFVINDYLPVASHLPYEPTVGSLFAVAPIVYLGWILGAGAALLFPRQQRRLATVCVVGTLLSLPAERALPPNAGLWQMVLLVGFGFPAALALPLESRPRRLPACAVAAAITFGLAGLSVLPLHILSSRGGIPFYLSWNFEYGLVQVIPFFVAPLALAIALALTTRRSDLAGGITYLATPWLIMGAAYSSDESAGRIVCALAFGACALWLLSRWSLDHIRVTRLDSV